MLFRFSGGQPRIESAEAIAFIESYETFRIVCFKENDHTTDKVLDLFSVVFSM